VGFKNLNTQSVIKNNKVKEPLVLDIRAEYVIACPNPVTLEIEVISGDPNEHTYQWTLLNGSYGRFIPNSRSLFVIFDQRGTRDTRILELVVDKGELYEQRFEVTLNDKAISFANNSLGNESEIFGFTNQPDRAVSILDMSFYVDNLPLYEEKEIILRGGSSGRLILPNEEIWKVQILRWDDLELKFENYYPDREISGVDRADRFITRTWYKYGNLPPIYAWAELELINIPSTDNLVNLIVRDNAFLYHADESSNFLTLLGGMGDLLLVEDNAFILLYNESSRRRVNGPSWDLFEEEEENNPEIIDRINLEDQTVANNSFQLQVNGSSSVVLELLQFKTGVVG
jgi:hypothetical protein